jgi:hypothetical protein
MNILFERISAKKKFQEKKLKSCRTFYLGQDPVPVKIVRTRNTAFSVADPEPIVPNPDTRIKYGYRSATLSTTEQRNTFFQPSIFFI